MFQILVEDDEVVGSGQRESRIYQSGSFARQADGSSRREFFDADERRRVGCLSNAQPKHQRSNSFPLSELSVASRVPGPRSAARRVRWRAGEPQLQRLERLSLHARGLSEQIGHLRLHI